MEALMIKAIGKVFLVLISVTVVGLGGLWLYTQNRTFLNKEDEIGNSVCNIYNGGLFCEQDDHIYFSNLSDDGSLYVTDSNLLNFQKLHDDKAVYINVDRNYIYYVRANNTRENSAHNILMYNNTGIYRIKQNGSNLKAVSYQPGAYLTLKGNHLYYQKYDVDSGLFLYQNNIECSEEKLLIKDAVIPAAVTENKLYYAGLSYDHNFNTVDLSTCNTRAILEGGFLYPIFYSGYLYYINIGDNYKIYRANEDGSDPVVLVDDRCSTYNITNSGKYLYYQVDNGVNNEISRIDLTTLKSETLLDGNYKQIHVTDQYVFFRDFDDTTTFVILADGIADVNTFNPPNLSRAE
ncbi:MAG: DUF5050 domain-containing protein [Lachnospiraceae bacterium]|jgi:hypothetical protein|nr:DUF5050 domain-containing protein [Lachnospiraceae bacterium]